MIVLGGGPVGSSWRRPGRRSGTEVTLIEGDDRILPARSRSPASRWPTRCAEARRRRPHRRQAERVVQRPETASRSSSTAASGSRPRSCWSRSGRSPRTAGIGLETVGVEPGEGGFLETDDRLRVGGRDWLYAVGDVNGRALFTHMGKYQAWVAAENVLGRDVEAVAEEVGSPRVTFTDPQVAAVGKTLEQAQEDGIDATRGRRADRRAPRAPASTARRPAAPRGSSSTRAAGRSSARPSPASRPPTSSTPRRSRSSARSRWSASATRLPPTRPAARSG